MTTNLPDAELIAELRRLLDRAGPDATHNEISILQYKAVLAFLDEGESEDAVFNAIFDHEGSCLEQAKAAIRALRALAQEKQP